MKCPVCEDQTLLMSNKGSVEIDYCPKCRGVWLDRGELDKIIEQSSSSVLKVNEGLYKRGEFQNKSYKKKKESWLGELFDF